jgi:acetyl-CoA/propionyl-CoA carboxylase biotin carboxyl carrier protein
VAAGDEVSSNYDPMVAKVIAWGPDRATAWKRLEIALDASVVHGPVTNLPFLRELVAHPRSIAGDFDTGTIERDLMPERAARDGEGAHDLLAAVIALADHFDLAGNGSNGAAPAVPGAGRAAAPDPFAALGGWRHPGLGSGGAR